MKIDLKTAWEPYSPSENNPWNLRKVGHVYRRAAFGATWDNLQEGLKLGPQKLLDKLLTEQATGNGYNQETDEFLAAAARKFNEGNQASSWWLYRMMNTGFPLREKIALFWHNHFATSNNKVQNVPAMVSQYELIRQHALGNFADLLQGISKDPAMMIWLDTVESKKGQPNENYARELMELFSLGIGNYTEMDIREAARAFTGWSLEGNRFVFKPKEHDDSPKTVLGRTGKWKGEDIVKICLEQPACPRFIVRKLYRFLISETESPSQELIEPLAQSFAKDWNFGKVVETMLRSNLFFSPVAYRTRIKPPVDFVTGAAKALEGRLGAAGSSVNLQAATEALGQHLFHPPSVKGWDGGETWLNAQTLLYRQNFALDLCRRPAEYRQPAAAFALASRYRKLDSVEMVNFFLDLFLQGDIPEEARGRITDYAKNSHQKGIYSNETERNTQKAIGVAHLIMSLPEYQLS